MGTRDFESQLHGMRLTTAEITYRLPDFRDILQTYIWQALDMAPRFPELLKFLKFWKTNLDGKLHSVRVGSIDVIQTPQIRTNASHFVLH